MGGLNILIHAIHLEQHLTYDKQSLSVIYLDGHIPLGNILRFWLFLHLLLLDLGTLSHLQYIFLLFLIIWGCTFYLL